MSARSWAPSDDLAPATIVVLAVALLAGLVLLALELGRRERYGALIVSTGVVAALTTALAVLRPVRVDERGSVVGPRVVVLVDASRRMALSAPGGTRRERALGSVAELRRRFADARLSVLDFGSGAPTPLSEQPRWASESDLASAVAALADSAGERPRAIVVVSDGRLSRPGAGADDDALRGSVGALGVPVHTVRVLEQGPKDASIRSVRVAGAAVAHQPLSLTIEVGCSADLACGSLPVAVRELRQGTDPGVLASGLAKVEDSTATLELRVTLDRAGARVVEISLDSPEGDQVPENDVRRITFSVAKERIRLLHVAGRPTYDVRTLRMWLKSDESVDTVAFFILRADSDDPMVDDDSELALIPFPVEELFTQHLPSFDAIVLQDIDAVRYKLAQHLPALAQYVEAGGGLILVGGPSSFAAGGYGGTALDRVLPVQMPEAEAPFDTAEHSPVYTEAGRAAPVLRTLRELFGDDLPTMAGANTLGAPRPGAVVLLEHPTRKAGTARMPVLALGEAGDGRTIALGVDGSYRLAWSESAAEAGGRGFGALWDGLLGWLMRDPRFDVARIELPTECVAGEPVTLVLHRLPGAEGDVRLTVEKLGKPGNRPLERSVASPPPGPVPVDVGKLEPGGYVARARVGESPPSRLDFACERGGEAWSDTRPDPARLERIAQATGGRSVTPDQVAELPLPAATRIAAERHVAPLLPPWAWTALAAVALGGHWLARRRGGLV